MPDENDETNEQTTEDQESEGTEETTEEETSEEGTSDDGEDQGEDGEDEESKLDLDGAKKALTKVRKEAASARTKLRDLEAKLADAKTPEQVEELVSELKAANAAEAHALVVENVALKYKLPDDLAAALKGESREELEEHAKVLSKYVPSDAGGNDPDLGGGLDPSGDADGAFDPVKAAQEARKNRWS